MHMLSSLATFLCNKKLTGTLDKGVLDGVVWPKDEAGMAVKIETMKSESKVKNTH